MDIQTEAFEKQMLWAFEKNLPVAVHCRDAYDEVITSIASMEAKRPKGVLHCFTGTIEQANALIDLGFLLGIGGVVTFKNSGLDKVVEQVDLQHLILETDAPYLAPTPYRGKRNEPYYTALVAEKIAAVKGLENPLESVGKPTQKTLLTYSIGNGERKSPYSLHWRHHWYDRDEKRARLNPSDSIE